MSEEYVDMFSCNEHAILSGTLKLDHDNGIWSIYMFLHVRLIYIRSKTVSVCPRTCRAFETDAVLLVRGKHGGSLSYGNVRGQAQYWLASSEYQHEQMCDGRVLIFSGPPA